MDNFWLFTGQVRHNQTVVCSLNKLTITRHFEHKYITKDSLKARSHCAFLSDCILSKVIGCTKLNGSVHTMRLK